MVRSAIPSPSRLQRKRLYVALATLLGLASGIAHAQQSAEDVSVPVTGRAPAIVIAGVVNESVPASLPRVGHVLRVDANATDADGDSITSTTYRWLRDGVEVANTVTYTPVADDAGKTLVVEVTANTDVNSSDPAIGTAEVDVAIVDNRAPTADLMSIVGTIQVGVQVSGAYRFQDLDDDLEGPSTFKWFRADTVDGPKTEISGQTSRNYTLRVADEGKFIFFEVTPHSSTGEPRIGTPAMIGTTVAVAGADGQVPVANNVAINGTAQVGQVLDGTYDFHDADNDLQGTSTFKWYRADTAGGTRTEIAGENGQSYTLKIADEGKFVFFEVTPRSATGEPKAGNPVIIATSGSIAAANGAAPTANNVVINGTIEVNSTLTASYDFDDDDGDQEGTSTFKWYRADTETGTRTEIVGETSLTYTLQIADEGKFVFFEVTPRSATGEPKSGTAVLANTTTAVAATDGAAPTATNVTIEGTIRVGSVINGKYLFDDVDGDDEGASGFTWYRADDAVGTNRSEIPGATARNYTLHRDDEGKFVFFEVTPQSATGLPRIGDLAGAVTDTVVAPLHGSAPRIGRPVIEGELKVGSEVRAVYSFNDVDGDLEGDTYFEWWTYVLGGSHNYVFHSGTGEAGRKVTLPAAVEGVPIYVEVTPKSATGTPRVGREEWEHTAPRSVEANEGSAPIANDVAIAGVAQVGSALNATYRFYDNDDDLESGTIFSWYRADTIDGPRTEIAGQTGQSYTLQIADEGKFVFLEVTPRSRTGLPKLGTPVLTNTETPVAPTQGAAPTVDNLGITGVAQVN